MIKHFAAGSQVELYAGIRRKQPVRAAYVVRQKREVAQGDIQLRAGGEHISDLGAYRFQGRIVRTVHGRLPVFAGPPEFGGVARVQRNGKALFFAEAPDLRK